MSTPVTADRLPPVSFPEHLFDPEELGDCPVTEQLVALLSDRKHLRGGATLERQLDVTLVEAYRDHSPAALADVHRALFVIYETSFANPLSAACAHEHAPWLVQVRRKIERVWLEHDIQRVNVPAARVCEAMGAQEVERWFINTASAAPTAVDKSVVDFLERAASVEDIKTFVMADAHLNYRFFDALVLALPHYLEPVKCEISEHFWEESGEGSVDKSHTRQFTRSLDTLGLQWQAGPGWSDWRPYAGHNLYFCLGLARQHYFKALGNLAMPELFDVARDQALVNGFRRLGFNPESDFEYYWNHVEADAEHGPGWLTGVILPIADAQPAATHELMLGGALRMQAMTRFNEYLSDRFELSCPA